MRLADWTVIQHKEEVCHRYIYGDINEYRQQECDPNEDFDIIEFDQWTVADCVSLIDNLFEDINKHSMGDITDIIRNTMEAISMSSDDQQKFMRSLTVRLFDRYGGY